MIDIFNIFAYNVGMKTIQYTIRSVSPQLDRHLRQLAKLKCKSLNQIVLDTLEQEAGNSNDTKLNHSLDGLAGTWVEDPEFDATIDAFEQIDPEKWQ